MERYALYFAPAPETDLASFGAAWLGRDAYTGEMIEHEDIGFLDSARLFEITASPRNYGFHATIKAPFEVVDGTSFEDLKAALDAFASRTSAFEAPALEVKSLHGFTAFVLSEPSPEMDAMHRDAVTSFEPFRAPMSDEDRARRRPERLSERQREYLDRYGYPLVFEEFLFHMTLTERLSDPEEQEMIMDLLEPIDALFGSSPLQVDGLCLFHQPDRQSPFTVRHRAVFSG